VCLSFLCLSVDPWELDEEGELVHKDIPYDDLKDAGKKTCPVCFSRNIEDTGVIEALGIGPVLEKHCLACGMTFAVKPKEEIRDEVIQEDTR
jgi:hypothetical protein